MSPAFTGGRKQKVNEKGGQAWTIRQGKSLDSVSYTHLLLIPSPGHAPATAWIGPGFLNARKTPMGGFDVWGVEYVATKETGYMSLPKPGRFILDDICRWRDIIKAPDISHIDWETMAKKDLAQVDRTQTSVTATIHVGYFQQLMNLMGFTEGLCAMLEEPEEVMALFEYMNQFLSLIHI